MSREKISRIITIFFLLFMIITSVKISRMDDKDIVDGVASIFGLKFQLISEVQALPPLPDSFMNNKCLEEYGCVIMNLNHHCGQARVVIDGQLSYWECHDEVVRP